MLLAYMFYDPSPLFKELHIFYEHQKTKEQEMRPNAKKYRPMVN